MRSLCDFRGAHKTTVPAPKTKQNGNSFVKTLPGGTINWRYDSSDDTIFCKLFKQQLQIQTKKSYKHSQAPEKRTSQYKKIHW